MKLIILSALVVMASCLPPTPDDIENEWQKFKSEFRGSNGFQAMADEPKRRQVFETNYKTIVSHNDEADKGIHTYRMGVNQFADWTDEEFQQKMLSLHMKPLTDVHNLTQYVRNTNSKKIIPPNQDWTSKESRIKNQGSCGSCFAFASVDTIESHYTINTGNKIELSPQNIVDCLYRSDVCQTGGSLAEAYNLVKKNGGIMAESDYPYEGEYGTCSYKPYLSKVTVSGYEGLDNGDEVALKEMVSKGPVALGIDASLKSFKLYSSGVYVDNTCHNPMNHGVVAAGYGVTSDGQEYWLIKNSWDKTWGEAGYMKMARNNDNQCGIGLHCLTPTGVTAVSH
ncbi:unnamed protein product [Oppiella nova]|uniref:Cathepsin L n=1 Tax=Oppiella nova TaxID=334625 RepID=A0A7R9M9T0_9ACAR|nr:unnamed protein product [Oppiella nova]CAG2173261.1 unnamed protein product [Oppiella nova]